MTLAYASSLFLLCCVAWSISLPMNSLAPHLSRIALEFQFNIHERNKYLGGWASLSMMLGQIIGTFISMIYADNSDNRKKFLSLTFVIGNISLMFFVFCDSFFMLLVLRLLSGVVQGTCTPIIFSMVGDIWSPEERPKVAAMITAALGGGTLCGQIFAGLYVELIGWRVPFAIMGVVGIFTVILFWIVFTEPNRGASESEASGLNGTGLASVPKLSFSTFASNIKVPTVTLLIVQAVPNTIPWGILSVHLHDYLASETGLSMQGATFLIALFGAGAAFGGLSGGFIGTYLNFKNKRYLPVFMGVSTVFGALLMQKIMSINFRLDDSNISLFAGSTIVFGGALAAVNGPNIRATLLNITGLEARAAIIAASNLANAIGRGIGPSLAGVYMRYLDINRRDTVTCFLNLWIVAGLILTSITYTIVADEQRLTTLLRKLVNDVN